MTTTDILSQINWIRLEEVPKSFSHLPIQLRFEGKIQKNLELHHCEQVHGTSLAHASFETTGPKASSRQVADALWTSGTELAIAVKTADCLPALFFFPKKSDDQPAKVAAAHAGWRGLSQGILPKTIGKLCKASNSWLRPKDCKDCHVFLGPCIGPAVYEVGPEVVAAFKTAESIGLQELGFCLTKGLKDRWFLDLAAYGALELVCAGVPAQNIHVLRSCTYSHSDIWFSYRREGYTGSNWNWISILPEANR